MMSPALLYRAANLVNGKCYIGITQRSLAVRSKRHIATARAGGGSCFGAAIRKHGKDKFVFSTLVICPTIDYAKELEIRAIATLSPEYNVTKGGDGCVGYRHTEEHKRYIKQIMKGKNRHKRRNSPEAIEKMRIAKLAWWATRKKPKPEKKELFSKRWRRVICLSTGVIFRSTLAASKAYGFRPEAVYEAARYGHNTAGGIKFKFVDQCAAASGEAFNRVP